MGWSDAQRAMLFKAVAAAGWNDQQRYIAMRHAGCPCSEADGGSARDRRPSVANPRNTHRQFEIVMSLAEASARGRGAGKLMPGPGKPHASWADAATFSASREQRLIEAIWREAMTRAPAVFQAGGLIGFIERMTARDETAVTLGRLPTTTRELDPGQTYRVLEGLKAWVGRVFAERGITPQSFTPHAPHRRPRTDTREQEPATTAH